MSEIFNNPGPLGLIDPIDLEEEHVIGNQMVPVAMLGIFNPMGPTLFPISIIRNDEFEFAYVLMTSLNPFSNKRELVARIEDSPESLCSILPELRESKAESLPVSLPTLMACVGMSEEMLSLTSSAIVGMLKSVELSEPLSDTVASYRSHPGDPWSRIPSFGEMMKSAKEERPKSVITPTEDEWEAWQAVMTDPEHFRGELMGILHAWDGSISNFGGGMPHMPVDEAMAEITSMGFPFFAPPGE